MPLNNTEKYMIQRFVENEIQREAVRKVFEDVFDELWKEARTESAKIEKNNADLGELMRVCEFSQRQLHKAFIRLEQYRKVEEKTKKTNQGL